jgi:hypothetical protein
MGLTADLHALAEVTRRSRHVVEEDVLWIPLIQTNKNAAQYPLA